MKYTEKLGLKKPDQTDFYNVEDSNYNMDKIDTEITTVKSSIEKVATDLGNIELTAKKVTIEDTEGNFLSPVVEGALQELASKDKTLDTKIDATKATLDTKIDTTKTTLETSIVNNKTEIDSKIEALNTELGTNKAVLAGNINSIREVL